MNHKIFGHRSSWLARFPKQHRHARARYLRRQAMAVPLPDGRVLCRVLGELKMYVDPLDRDIAPHLMLDGIWEPRTTEAIVDRIRPGMTCADVGANLGYFALLMAACTGAEGHVLAFEPNPAVAAHLAGSVAVNGFADRVTLHPTVLAEEAGRAVELFVPPMQAGGARAIGEARDGDVAVPVLTDRFDQLPGAGDVALVKIDTEGMEHLVWQGMAAMIAGDRLRHIVLEFTKPCYPDPGALLDEMTAAGFTLQRIEEERGVTPVTRAEVLAGADYQMLMLDR